MSEEVIDVNGVQNIDVLRQLAAERAAELRRRSRRIGHASAGRRGIGRAIARLGAWIAAEPHMRPSAEGAR